MFVGDKGPALPRWRVTGVPSFHVRGGLCSRIVLVARCFRQLFQSRASTAPKQQHTYHGSQKSYCTPIAAHKNHEHTHCGTAGVPLAHVAQSGWWLQQLREGSRGRYFFDRRRRCCRGSRGCRASLQQHQF